MNIVIPAQLIEPEGGWASTRQRLRHKCKYPSCWPKVSYLIRRLASGTCEWCHCPTKQLSVHHIGVPYANGRPGNPHDKHDLRRENLAALCSDCHEAADQAHSAYAIARSVQFHKHRALQLGTGLVPYRQYESQRAERRRAVLLQLLVLYRRVMEVSL